MELVAADEPPVLVEPLLDAVIVEDGQGDGCFSYTTRTDEGDWGEVFDETNDLLDQFIPSETCPRWLGRRFSQRSWFKGEVLVL